MEDMEMTIQYKGRNIEEERKNPEAWIWYDEDNKEETKKADDLAELLKKEGWKCFCEEGFITIPLYWGKDEYLDLVYDYKKAKKVVHAR